MNLDLACVLTVVAAAVAGAFGGAIRQLTRLGAVAAGWLGSRWLAPQLAPLLQGKVPAFAAHPIATVAAFLGCTVVALIAARLVLALTPLRRLPGSGTDRATGALLGAAQACVVVWVALSALASWGKPISLGGITLDPSTSELAGLARDLGTPARALGERGGKG